MARRILGIVALVCLLVGFNLLVWERTLFQPIVLGALAAGTVLGLVWLAWTIFAAGPRVAGEGRAAGSANAVLASTIFLSICIVLFALAKYLDISVDLTQEGRRELAPQTVQVLQTMSQEVKVTCIFTDIDDELIQIARDKTLRFLEQAQKYSPLLKVEELDPQTDMEFLKGLGLSHASPQGTIVVAAGTRQKVITLSGGSPRLEEREFTNTLVNVLRNAQPKCYFLSGHDERDIADKQNPEGAGTFAQMLQMEAYLVERLSIEMQKPEVPADCDILIMNAPKGDLRTYEVDALQRYVQRGGRTLLLINPLVPKQANMVATPNLAGWLQAAFSVELSNNLVLTDVGGPVKQSQVELRTDGTAFESVEDVEQLFRGAFNAGHPITRAFNETVVLSGARAMSFTPREGTTLNGDVLVRTPPTFWAETDIVGYNATKGHVTRDPHETYGILPLALAVTGRLDEPQEGRPGDARLVIVGDGDIADNGHLPAPGNFNLVFNTLAWLSESEELIAIRATGKADPPIVLTVEQKSAVVWVSTLLTLQLTLAVWLLVYLVRRRNQ